MSGVANKCFNDPLAVYTIHRDPEDHPGKWVVRQRNIPGGDGSLVLLSIFSNKHERRSRLDLSIWRRCRATSPICLRLGFEKDAPQSVAVGPAPPVERVQAF